MNNISQELADSLGALIRIVDYLRETEFITQEEYSEIAKNIEAASARQLEKLWGIDNLEGFN
jgi:hypothetical protein